MGLSLRRRWPLAVAALVAGAAVVALAALVPVGGGGSSGGGRPGPRPPSGIGAPAPDFRLPDLRQPSDSVALDDFADRPLVVNFWASWCVPCAEEMPFFQRVYERVKNRVAFVGIDHQDTRPEALALLRRTGVRYPVAYDPEGRTARDYGLFGMPSTVFVSASGRVVEGHGGPMTERDLEATIARLFRTG